MGTRRSMLSLIYLAKDLSLLQNSEKTACIASFFAQNDKINSYK
jgi:hypothetical protein